MNLITFIELLAVYVRDKKTKYNEKKYFHDYSRGVPL